MKDKLKELNGKYYQECEVAMLATDKATWPNCIWLGRISNQLRLDTSYNNSKSILPIDNSMLPQHLYFLSNEEIKEGNYVIDSIGELFGPYEKGDIIGKEAKKIIATTDSSLQLPKSSKEFIQAYIKAYNEGKPITKVLVEYKDWCDYDDDCTWGGLDKSDWKLKINSFNEIIIKKVKDSWTREEMFNCWLYSKGLILREETHQIKQERIEFNEYLE